MRAVDRHAAARHYSVWCASVISCAKASRRLVAAASLSLLVLLCPAGGGRSAAAATAGTTVVLHAAAAVDAQGKLEVRLRWSLQDGWLPDGGFNVFRYDGAAAGASSMPALNRAPLGVVTTAGVPATVRMGNTRTLQLSSLLSKATSSGALPPLSPTVARGASAQAKFAQLGASARQLHSAQAMQAAVATAATARIAPVTGATPAVNSPLQSAVTGPAAATKLSSTAVRRAPPTAADITMQARRTLLMSAALYPEVAATLGLAFDDPNVTPGQTYTYRLTSAKDSAQLGTVTITVPRDSSGLKPAAPTGLEAQQLNADSVAIRWQRLSAADEAAMGVAQYDIYRLSVADTMAASPADAHTVATQGKKLNDTPILVTDSVSADSGAASSLSGSEAASFYTDTSPRLGNVIYRLTVTDIYGRTSDAVQLSFTVQDWHKPLPVPYVGAQIAPRVAAERSAFRAARSRQYRRTAPFFKGALGVAPPAQQALIAWTPSYQDARLNTIWESNRPPDPDVAYQIYRIDTEQPRQAPVLLTATPILPALTPAAQLPVAPQVSTLVSSLHLEPNSVRDALATAACLNMAGQATTLQQNCRNISANPQFENTLLAAMNVYTYVDSGVTKDHYYQYLVVAVFKHDSQQSTPSPSNVAAYPNLTPPGTVSNAASSFQQGTVVPTPVSGLQTGGPVARTYSLSNWTAPLVRAPPRDLGGSLTLSWTAGSQDVKYEIYRANATRPKSVQHLPASATTSRIRVAAVALNWQTLGDPLGAGATAGTQGLEDSDFVLLGTSKVPTYVDQLSRSSAQYYVYRIVPLNRWNVPGPLTSLTARVPATLAPTTPKLLVGTASPDGGVQVEFASDGDSSEEVVTYELWRSTLYGGVASAGSNGSGASGAGAAGVVSGTASSPGNGKPASAPIVGGAMPTSAPLASRAKPTLAARAGSAKPTSASLAGSAKPTSVSTPGVGSSGLRVNSAARYGVVTRQSTVSAAVRAGVGPLSALTAGNLATMSATRVATVTAATLPSDSNSGTWLVEAPSNTLSWRNEYVYWVRAVDSDNLQSDSDFVDVRPLKISAAAPANLNASWDASRCAVNLTWQRTDADTAGFLIERELIPAALPAASNGPHTPSGVSIATVNFAQGEYVQLTGITAATTVSFADSSAFPDNSYSYRVRTVDQAGNESPPTVLAQTVAIPDGCGDTSIHHIDQTSSAGSAPAPDSDSSTPIVSPRAPSVPKPADEIVIPATRPN